MLKFNHIMGMFFILNGVNFTNEAQTSEGQDNQEITKDKEGYSTTVKVIGGIGGLAALSAIIYVIYKWASSKKAETGSGASMSP